MEWLCIKEFNPGAMRVNHLWMDVAPQEWIGWDWDGVTVPGGVRYRAPYGAK